VLCLRLCLWFCACIVHYTHKTNNKPKPKQQAQARPQHNAEYEQATADTNSLLLVVLVNTENKKQKTSLAVDDAACEITCYIHQALMVECLGGGELSCGEEMLLPAA
jgi:hypothetical protein